MHINIKYIDFHTLPKGCKSVEGAVEIIPNLFERLFGKCCRSVRFKGLIDKCPRYIPLMCVVLGMSNFTTNHTFKLNHTLNISASEMHSIKFLVLLAHNRLFNNS